MRSLLAALVCVFVLTASSSARCEPPAKPAPQTQTKKKTVSIPGAVVGGAVGLAMGLPLLLVSTLVSAVCLGSMGVVLVQVQDWDSGEFKLDEESKSRDNKEVIQRRAWTWGRNVFPFAFIGVLLGFTVTAAAAATLVGGFLAMPQE